MMPVPSKAIVFVSDAFVMPLIYPFDLRVDVS
jgi:hypothetical protein